MLRRMCTRLALGRGARVRGLGPASRAAQNTGERVSPMPLDPPAYGCSRNNNPLHPPSPLSNTPPRPPTASLRLAGPVTIRFCPRLAGCYTCRRAAGGGAKSAGRVRQAGWESGGGAARAPVRRPLLHCRPPARPGAWPLRAAAGPRRKTKRRQAGGMGIADWHENGTKRVVSGGACRGSRRGARPLEGRRGPWAERDIYTARGPRAPRRAGAMRAPARSQTGGRAARVPLAGRARARGSFVGRVRGRWAPRARAEAAARWCRQGQGFLQRVKMKRMSDKGERS